MVTLDQFLTGGLPLVMDFQKCWFDKKYPSPVKLYNYSICVVLAVFFLLFFYEFKELSSVLYSLSNIRIGGLLLDGPKQLSESTYPESTYSFI